MSVDPQIQQQLMQLLMSQGGQQSPLMDPAVAGQNPQPMQLPGMPPGMDPAMAQQMAGQMQPPPPPPSIQEQLAQMIPRYNEAIVEMLNMVKVAVQNDAMNMDVKAKAIMEICHGIDFLGKGVQGFATAANPPQQVDPNVQLHLQAQQQQADQARQDMIAQHDMQVKEQQAQHQMDLAASDQSHRQQLDLHKAGIQADAHQQDQARKTAQTKAAIVTQATKSEQQSQNGGNSNASK